MKRKISATNKTGATPKTFSTIKAWLRTQTADQLAALLLNICQEQPSIAVDVANRIDLENKNTTPLMRKIRQEIKALAEGKDWERDYGYPPDYSSLLKNIKQLLPLGMADELLRIMPSFLEAVRKQVDQFDNDEGELAEVGKLCYAATLEVLRVSTLAPAQKLLWAIDLILDDQYELSDVFEKYLDEKHQPATWSAVADELVNRLQKQKTIEGKRDWDRDRLSDFTILALEEAGRKDEIIAFCEREVTLTKSYDRLVSRLMKAGRTDDAERYITQGVAATYKDSAGMASSLRRMRTQIYSDRRDWARVLVHEVCEFVEYPSEFAYGKVKKSAAKVKQWPQMRVLLLEYLQSGVLPWRQKAWVWPAPDQIELARDDRWKKSFPNFTLLIAIAILEKEPAEVVKWHDRLKIKEPRGRSLDLEVAEAVKQYDPERSLTIWKRMAEIEIAHTSPYAYQTAGRYLKKAGKLMATLKSETEWHDYIVNLRAAHVKKRRLMEVLDALKA